VEKRLFVKGKQQGTLGGSTDKVLQRFAPALCSHIHQFRAMCRANGHWSTTAESADQHLTPEAKAHLQGARCDLANEQRVKGIVHFELVNKLKLKLETEGRGRTKDDQRRHAKLAKPITMLECDWALADGRRGELMQVTATQETIDDLQLEEHCPGLVGSKKCFGRLGKVASQEGTDCVANCMWSRHREHLPLNTSPEKLRAVWAEGLGNAVNAASTSSGVHPADTKHSRAGASGRVVSCQQVRVDVCRELETSTRNRSFAAFLAENLSTQNNQVIIGFLPEGEQHI
jgi:hypothetical protein